MRPARRREWEGIRGGPRTRRIAARTVNEGQRRRRPWRQVPGRCVERLALAPRRPRAASMRRAIGSFHSGNLGRHPMRPRCPVSSCVRWRSGSVAPVVDGRARALSKGAARSDATGGGRRAAGRARRSRHPGVPSPGSDRPGTRCKPGGNRPIPPPSPRGPRGSSPPARPGKDGHAGRHDAGEDANATLPAGIVRLREGNTGLRDPARRRGVCRGSAGSR